MTAVERMRIRCVPAAAEAPLLCAVGAEEWAEPLTETARAAGCSLLLVDGADWDRDLAPWPADVPLRGTRHFPGGGHAYMEELAARLPAAEGAAGIRPCGRAILGYSLAGLFALYAACNCAAFSACASVSGSLWMPELKERAGRWPYVPRAAYFSLGDRESSGRNPVFRRTEACTARLSEALAERGAVTVFESVPGGHFDRAPERTQRAAAWLAERQAAWRFPPG